MVGRVVVEVRGVVQLSRSRLSRASLELSALDTGDWAVSGLVAVAPRVLDGEVYLLLAVERGAVVLGRLPVDGGKVALAQLSVVIHVLAHILIDYRYTIARDWLLHSLLLSR